MPQKFTVELKFATLQKALEVAKAFDGFADDVSIDLGIEETACWDCGSPRGEVTIKGDGEFEEAVSL